MKTSKEQKAKYNRRYRHKRRAVIDAIKAVPCIDCGKRYPSCVMDFDHVRGEKLFSIGANLMSYPIVDVLIEIAKCEVVCANCHRLRTYKKER